MNSRSKRFCTIFVMIACLVQACQKNSSVSLAFNDAIIQSDNSSLLDSEVLLIVPKAGCEGCISAAVYFTKDNLPLYNNLKVIFTGIGSKKALKVRLGAEIYNHPNVYIDDQDIFLKKEITEIYPAVFYLKNRKVEKVSYLSPEEPTTLDDLLSFLISTN